jgi:hypothetical protein
MLVIKKKKAIKVTKREEGLHGQKEDPCRGMDGDS